MRPVSFLLFVLSLLVSLPVNAQTAQSQAAAAQTARQALIEMFFGQSPNHLEKHLPEVTRRAFESLEESDGRNVLGMLSGIASESKNGKESLETFDTGSTLVEVTGLGGGFDKLEITVEGDSLSGDEDQIDLAVHMYRAGKEETLPFIPRFTFAMKNESDVWRLNEVSVAVRMPLADPDFLKGLLERQRSQNEQMTQYSMNSVVSAERAYQSANGTYACTLSALGSAGKKAGAGNYYLYDPQLISGKKNGYGFALSACDASHYQLVAEPAAAESGQRAFCADESGTVRSSSDGKATTCLSSGAAVEKPSVLGNSEGSTGGASVARLGTTPSPQRIRISQGVSAGLLLSQAPPHYPPDARAARIQGTVVMKALINQAGEVVNLELISGHPMLAPAAMDAVKQWKYKPYLLKGNPVQVETQVTVNFTLSGR